VTQEHNKLTFHTPSITGPINSNSTHRSLQTNLVYRRPVTSPDLPRPVHLLSGGQHILPPEEVRSKFIQATHSFGELLRPTFGPNGQRKLLWSKNGEMSVTRDGAKICAELLVRHPAAKQLVELAAAQESAMGDGTTRAVLFASALMSQSAPLIDRGIHSLSIVEGWLKSLELVLDHLTSSSASADSSNSEAMLRATLSGIGDYETRNHLLGLLSQMNEQFNHLDSRPLRDHVWMAKSRQGGVTDSSFVCGAIVEKRRPARFGAESLTDARVLLVRQGVEVSSARRSIEIEVGDAEGYHAMLDAQAAHLDQLALVTENHQADLILVGGPVHRRVLHQWLQQNRIVLADVDHKELDRVALVTGARVADRLQVVEDEDIGKATNVDLDARERNDEWEERWFIRSENSESITFDIGGQGDANIEETVRQLHDAIRMLECTNADQRSLAGGGAAEVSAAMALRHQALGFTRQERLIAEAFANALESIPAILLENAGRSILDGLLELRSAHTSDRPDTGILSTGLIGPMEDVRDPLIIVKHALTHGVECICSLLRVDRVIGRKGSV